MSNDQSPTNVFLILAVVLLSGGVIYQNWFVNAQPAATLPPQTVVPRTPVPRGDLGAGEEATIAVFKRTSPSVVFIRTKDVERILYNDGSIQKQERELSSGTGFIWDSNGYIVTNLHVVEAALNSTDSALEVQFDDKSVVDAQFIGGVREFDIALLRVDVDAERSTPIPLGTSDDLNVGQQVLAIGSPFGFDQTLSTGVIGGLNRSVAGSDGAGFLSGLVQTDAAINPGNSGGPLLDSAGRMIGVNTAIVSPTGAYSGLGFAVPVSSVIKAVATVLEASHVIQRPVLGISILSPAEARQLGAPEAVVRLGLFIKRIDPTGPAAGLRMQPITQHGNLVFPGDQITGLGDVSTTTPEELQAALNQHAPGDTVVLQILRGGQVGAVKIKLEARKLII